MIKFSVLYDFLLNTSNLKDIANVLIYTEPMASLKVIL